MRVLLLTQVLPFPPDSGPKVKTWNVLKYLSQSGHEVTLASFIRHDEQRHVPSLERHCRVHTVPMHRGWARDLWTLAASGVSGGSFLMRRDDRAAMRSLIDTLAAGGRFDVVHADQMNMAAYALRVTGARRVLDAHNALWLLYRRLAAALPHGPRRWLFAREWPRLRRYEADMCRQFDRLLVVSEEDRAAMDEAMGSASAATIMPIAIDPEETQPVTRRADANRIVHVGTMYWPPNIEGIRWFLDAVYPSIRRQRPDVGVDLIGARPPRALERAAARFPDVRVTGYVDDLTPYLQRAAAFVVPLHAGSGMRVKILTALAQGLPLVSTTVGSEGIAVVDGQHLLLADTAADFASTTLRLLGDGELAAALGRNGRALVSSQYDYRRVCRVLDDVYRGGPQTPVTESVCAG